MTPEQTLTDLEADLALLVPDLRRMFARAADALPGPRAAGGASSGGFDASDERYDRGQTDSDEHTPMNRDEARAINGPDVAERDVRAANESLLKMHAELGKLNSLLAPYRPRHRPFDPNDVPDGWCPNCYRLCDRQHAPTKLRKRDQLPEWSDKVCQFCGRFRAANGWLPTRKILQRHHGPGKVTEQLVEAEERALPRKVKEEIRRTRAERSASTSTQEFTHATA